jgi:VWFA-related protein
MGELKEGAWSRKADRRLCLGEEAAMLTAKNLIPAVASLVFLAGTALAWQEPNPPVPPAPVVNGSETPTEPPSLQLQVPTHITVPPPPPDPNEFRVSSEVDLVLLDVSVKDADGGFVAGLKKENFKVFDNKVEQPIRVFAAQDVPVTVGLVVDNSGSVRPKKPEIVTSALTFVTESNPKDEVFLVNFNDRVMMGLPQGTDFTDDRNLLRHSLLMSRPQGRTALYDAIKTALEHIEKGRLDKKTLVLISDGGDNASDTTRDEIMKMVERSIVTIYTVGIFNPEDKDKNPGFLKDIAKLSGGESYRPENINNLVGICQKIAHDIRNRYTVGFAPSVRDGDMKPHQLKLVVTNDQGKRLEVRTRTHYIPLSLRQSQVRSRGKEQ